jgi:hypothetical protein
MRDLIETALLSGGRFDADALRRTAESRARFRLPPGVYQTVLHAVVRDLWSRADDIASRLGAPADAVWEVGSRILAVTSTVAELVSAAQRRLDVDEVRADERRRAALVRDLLLRGDSRTDPRPDLAIYGIRQDAPVSAFRARAMSDEARTGVESALRDVAERSGGVVGPLGDDLAGVVTGPLAIAIEGATVALGLRTLVSELPKSFRIASRVLDAADFFGVTGVVTLEDLGPLVAIADDELIGDHLVASYIEPVRQLGTFGDVILNTLDGFFDNGMKIETTARSMYVHPNTLRYRVERYERLVGADLSQTFDQFQVWWALKRARFQAAPRATNV